ncbi:hypothetical protein QQ045_020310 [Rhodiola kirilowii]
MLSLRCANGTAGHSYSHHNVKWTAPELGILKVNFDAAVYGNKFGIGTVCRDSDGKLIMVAGNCVYGSNYSLLAEAIACRWSLQVVVRLGYTKMVIVCLWHQSQSCENGV